MITGITSTVSAPAVTSTDAIDSSMAPEAVATSVMATISGSAIVQYSAALARSPAGRSRVSEKCESAASMGTVRTSRSRPT